MQDRCAEGEQGGGEHRELMASVEANLDSTASCDQRCKDLDDHLLMHRVIAIDEIVGLGFEVANDDVVEVARVDAGVWAVFVTRNLRNRPWQGVEMVSDGSNLVGSRSLDPSKHHHVAQHASTLVQTPECVVNRRFLPSAT